MIRRRLIVHGHVQGVGFRWAIARAAESRGVSGWVTNRADGTVEAVLEGEPEAVESVVRLSREGPRGARVERVDVAEEEPEALSGFVAR
jgi:acylphosphatase